MSNMYRDSLHELVKPIIFSGKLKTEDEKRKDISQLRKAAYQEQNWAKSAALEGRAEKARGLKLPKGDPFRMELISDSNIAFSFAKIRVARSNKLTELADDLKKVMQKEREAKNKGKK
jgi:hypothetical protein